MSLRDFTGRRTWVYGSGSAAAVIMVLGILVILGLLGERYSWRWDATRDQSQSLTAATRNLLREVKQPLQLVVFYAEGQPERDTAKVVLDNMHYQNREISHRFVDPERDPLEAKRAGYRYPGNVLVEYEGKSQLANTATETDLAAAIRRLLYPQSKKVYFLTGHGERTLKEAAGSSLQAASQALEKGGLAVAELNLAQAGAVPPDATLVILAGPEKPLFPAELKALTDYLGRGGRVLALLEPFHDAGLKEMLASYGIGLDDFMVLDANQVSRALGASVTMPMVVQYGLHKITQDLTNVMTLFPLARPLVLAKEAPAGVHLTALATTTATSWAKKGQDWLKSGKANFDPATDRKGPFTLAALAQKRLTGPAAAPAAPATPPKAGPAADPPAPPDQDAVLVVYGDVDFADNRYFNISGNGDLFLNTVNFLAREEGQITVRTLDKKSQPLILTGTQSLALLLVVVVFPLGLIAAGVRAYARRRARR